jgi:RNA polymerase sigma factor (TIGR02999 family)
MAASPAPSAITVLLERARGGDEPAVSALVPLVYGELRRIAAGCLRRERPGHTLQATALVHEAYLKLVKQDEVDWQNRGHFFAVAAQAIRRILVDYARRQHSAKRGGGHGAVRLETDIALAEKPVTDWLAVDEALSELAQLNARQARIVELHFFGGLSLREVAECLAVSPRTVQGDWAMARAWLRCALRGRSDDPR